MSLKLEIGEFYLREDKTIVQLVRMATKLHNDGSFVDSNLNIYVPGGFMVGFKEDSKRVEKTSNIIAHIPKELHYGICDMVNNYYTDDKAKFHIDNAYINRNE